MELPVGLYLMEVLDRVRCTYVRMSALGGGGGGLAYAYVSALDGEVGSARMRCVGIPRYM